MFFTWLNLSIQTSDFKNINLYFCNYVVLNKQLLFFNILRQFIDYEYLRPLWMGFFSFFLHLFLVCI